MYTVQNNPPYLRPDCWNLSFALEIISVRVLLGLRTSKAPPTFEASTTESATLRYGLLMTMISSISDIRFGNPFQYIESASLEGYDWAPLEGRKHI